MDYLKTNEILMRRRNKVILPVVENANTETTNKYVCTMIKNIEGLGFTFSPRLYEELIKLPKQDLFVFYEELVVILKGMVGANVEYHPMYPNFPHSVMKKTEATLFLNAIVHYWSKGTLFPVEEKEERLPLFDTTKVTMIKPGTLSDIEDIFKNLCASKTSISRVDKDDLEYIMKNFQVTLPSEIPLKENVALIGKICLELKTPAHELYSYFKTATDVLRLATALSDGDLSLSTPVKYKSFSRYERRVLLDLLEHCGNIEEDMLRYKGQWIRVGERLHPGEYKQFEKVQITFHKLRNEVKIETFNSNVEKVLKEKEYVKAIELLKKRPGEFARRLDMLLRNVDHKNVVINTFKDIANQVSIPVLFQVRQHFMERDKEVRVFFPKGNLARSYALDNDATPIDEKYCQAVVQICETALVDCFKEREYMGKVYLSEEYKKYAIPFSQRSASKTLRTITRGSRLSCEENTNVIRGFIWWTNEEDDDPIDMDLSAVILNEAWEKLEHISYTHLCSKEFHSVHSGDITNGGPVDGDGVSEFLDIDINAVLERGGRYVVFQVYNYSMEDFSSMSHAMFGWMEREDGEFGEIFEPKTVKQKMDLASQSTVCIPVIFDCQTREVICCDMNLTINGFHSHCGGNNVESNIQGVAATCYAIVNAKKATLYNLIQLHIKARGIEVTSKEEADVIFDIEDGITPFDTDVFMGEYLV